MLLWKNSPLKRKTKAIATFVISILVVLTLLFAAQYLIIQLTTPTSPADSEPQENSLFIASFSPEMYGNIVLVNPTHRYFDNLNLTVKIDNLKLIVPDLHLAIGGNLSRAIPLARINKSLSIEPYKNETIRLLFGILDRDTFLSYFGDMQITLFSSHVIKFYVSKDKFGDLINGQSFLIPQKKAYIQIVGYSSIEH